MPSSRRKYSKALLLGGMTLATTMIVIELQWSESRRNHVAPSLTTTTTSPRKLPRGLQLQRALNKVERELEPFLDVLDTRPSITSDQQPVLPTILGASNRRLNTDKATVTSSTEDSQRLDFKDWILAQSALEAKQKTQMFLHQQRNGTRRNNGSSGVGFGGTNNGASHHQEESEVFEDDLIAKRLHDERVQELISGISKGQPKANLESNKKKQHNVKVQQEVHAMQKRLQHSFVKLENSTNPFYDLEKDRRKSKGGRRGDEFLYIVLTGKGSLAVRNRGILNTLARKRNVVWFSDATDEEERTNSTINNLKEDGQRDKDLRSNQQDVHTARQQQHQTKSKGLTLTKPIVLKSRFEHEVCRQLNAKGNEAANTQLKGCKYQWGFYRNLDMWEFIAKKVRQPSVQRPTHSRKYDDNDELEDFPFSDSNSPSSVQILESVVDMTKVKWIIRIADDTLVIPEHLERELSSLEQKVLLKQMMNKKEERGAHREKEQDVKILAGTNVSRSDYWFFSGGHPMAVSKGALEDFHQHIINSCEGQILDLEFADSQYRLQMQKKMKKDGSSSLREEPHLDRLRRDSQTLSRLKKFLWWADDVLFSYCIRKTFTASTSDVHLANLPGGISATSFEEFPLPQAPGLFQPVVVSHYQDFLPVNVSRGKEEDSKESSGKKTKAGGVGWRWVFTDGQIPTSYHCYPYVSSYQMYGLYNRLYFSRREDQGRSYGD